jgi:hypothetical protein
VSFDSPSYQHLSDNSLHLWQCVHDRPHFLWIWIAFKYRSTSLKEDEAFCFAVMLGLNPGSLLDVPPMNRFAHLFTLKDNYPSEILFLPGSKLEDPGLRWVPASFNDDNPSYFPSTYQSAGLRMPRGLLVRLPGIIFHPKHTLEDKSVLLLDKSKEQVFRFEYPANIKDTIRRSPLHP